MKKEDEEVKLPIIGFGTELEFKSFELKGINCISKKFSISKDAARGGGETYSLVIVSDKDVMRFKTGLNTTIEKLISLAPRQARAALLLNLIFSGAIKGAGDTRFIMWTIAALCLGGMVIPVFIAVEVFGMGIYTVWTLMTIYASALGVAFMLRYLRGKWKQMRVIEDQPHVTDDKCNGIGILRQRSRR